MFRDSYSPARGPLRAPFTVLTGAAVGVLLAACGGSSSTAGSANPTSAPTQGTAPSGGAGAPGGFGGADFTKIQACLRAAGISLPTNLPSAPSGAPLGLPSGAPSFNGTPPPGFTPGGQGGPGAGFLSDPTVRQALQACGIDLPSAPATGASGSATN